MTFDTAFGKVKREEFWVTADRLFCYVVLTCIIGVFSDPVHVVGYLRVHSGIRSDGARFHGPGNDADLVTVGNKWTTRIALEVTIDFVFFFLGNTHMSSTLLGMRNTCKHR